MGGWEEAGRGSRERKADEWREEREMVQEQSREGSRPGDGNEAGPSPGVDLWVLL